LSSISESRWWHLFTNEMNCWDSRTCSRIWHFQTPRLESGIFKCISWLSDSIFVG
jgi:hypothetical protein